MAAAMILESASLSMPVIGTAFAYCAESYPTRTFAMELLPASSLSAALCSLASVSFDADRRNAGVPTIEAKKADVTKSGIFKKALGALLVWYDAFAEAKLAAIQAQKQRARLGE